MHMHGDEESEHDNTHTMSNTRRHVSSPDECNMKKGPITVYDLILKYKLFKIPFIYIIVIYFFLMLLFESMGINFQMNKLLGYTLVISILFCFVTMPEFKKYALTQIYIVLIAIFSLILITVQW